ESDPAPKPDMNKIEVFMSLILNAVCLLAHVNRNCRMALPATPILPNSTHSQKKICVENQCPSFRFFVLLVSVIRFQYQF
ncbi:hypothetical protein, partial [Parafilimonas terrae]|uniref:hypothetical protein n=1 Tax=Parafilimonas terrae TaxID=1465490 RepID=UPI001C4302B0